MELLDFIIQKDKELLIFLNNLGTEQWDTFWLLVTNKRTWIPLFLLLIYLIIKSFDKKRILVILITIAILVTFTDQFTNLIKYSFERLRPCNDLSITNQLRILKQSQSFSFFSAHASNSFGVTTFLYLLLRKNFKWIGWLFIWPVLFAYSRVYIGMHFPSDILVGMLFGLLSGWGFYKITLKILNRIQ